MKPKVYEIHFRFRVNYDYWIKWMSDSWPTYKDDRRTDSNVGPWWFADALGRPGRRNDRTIKIREL